VLGEYNAARSSLNRTGPNNHGAREIYYNFYDEAGDLFSREYYLKEKRQNDISGRVRLELLNSKEERNGFYIEWHENGEVSLLARYANGIKVGREKRWSENGVLIANNLTEDDEELFFYENGLIKQYIRTGKMKDEKILLEFFPEGEISYMLIKEKDFYFSVTYSVPNVISTCSYGIDVAKGISVMYFAANDVFNMRFFSNEKFLSAEDVKGEIDLEKLEFPQNLDSLIEFSNSVIRSREDLIQKARKRTLEKDD
jgi:antitoxin component YwqK of YwqJK toxin-antitoxin module